MSIDNGRFEHKNAFGREAEGKDDAELAANIAELESEIERLTSQLDNLREILKQRVMEYRQSGESPAEAAESIV